MKVNMTYTIILTQVEAEALKGLLGTFSDEDKKRLHLDESQSRSMSELYDELPFREDA